MSSDFLSSILKSILTAEPCKLCNNKSSMGVYTVKGIPFKVCKDHYLAITSKREHRLMLKNTRNSLNELTLPWEIEHKEEDGDGEVEVKKFFPSLSYQYELIDLIHLTHLADAIEVDELKMQFKDDGTIHVRQLSRDHTQMVEAEIVPYSASIRGESAKIIIPTEILGKVLSAKSIRGNNTVKVIIPDERHITFMPDEYISFTLNTLNPNDESHAPELKLPRDAILILDSTLLLKFLSTSKDADTIKFEIYPSDYIMKVIMTSDAGDSTCTLDSNKVSFEKVVSQVSVTFDYRKLYDVLKVLKGWQIKLIFAGTKMPIGISRIYNSLSQFTVWTAPKIVD